LHHKYFIHMKKLLFLVFTMQVFFVFGQNESGPKISFISDTYDYGTIVVGSEHNGEADFFFVNTGNQPLVLSNVRAGCGCTSPYWHREPVLPGDTAKVVLKYTTMRHPHTINKSAIVQSNAVNSENVIIRITGNVVAQPPEMLPEKNVSNDFSPVAR